MSKSFGQFRKTFTLSSVAAAALVLTGSIGVQTTRADMPTLKDAYKNDFVIGVALPGELPGSLKPDELALAISQFNGVTPENCLKPQPTQPSEDVWNFTQPDALVAFAQQHGMQVTGHTLVWHSQTPKWFFLDGDKPASRELALARMKNHIQTLVTRYKGKVHGWDVVNEAISDKPDEYLRPESPWLKTVGDDYIEQAFKFAAEADPNVDLQYNDYNIEEPGKRAKAIRLIKDLQSKGIHVAAVGIQGHWLLDKIPYNDIEEAINEYHALGLKVMFTEVDLDVLPRKTTGANVSATERAAITAVRATPASPEVLQRQAEQYGKLFTLLLKHKDAVTRVTFWGINDGRSWLNTWPTRRYNHALLFDRQCQPKPAFDAVIKAAEGAQ